MIVKTISEKTARYIHENTDEKFDLDDLYFGMQIVWNFISIIALTLIGAAIFNTLIETIIGMVTFLLFRSLTGGYHLKYSEWCIAVSSVLLLSIPFVADYFTLQHFEFLVVICFVVTAVFSPHDPNSTFLKKYKYPCKVLALMSIICTYFIHSPLILTAMCMQATLLIHFKRKE